MNLVDRRNSFGRRSGRVVHLQEIDVPEERLVVVGVVLDVVDGVGGLLLVESGKSLVCNLTEILASWPATPSNSFRFIFSLKILANCGLYDGNQGWNHLLVSSYRACLQAHRAAAFQRSRRGGGLRMEAPRLPGRLHSGPLWPCHRHCEHGRPGLENGNGVIIRLVAKRQGLMLSLGGDAGRDPNEPVTFSISQNSHTNYKGLAYRTCCLRTRFLLPSVLS